MTSQTATTLKTGPVFWWNYTSKARVKVNQGGTRSGKTYSILEVICLRLIEKKRIATVVGQDGPNLSRGPIRDLNNILLEPKNQWLNSFMVFRAATRTYQFINGSVLEFVSYDTEQDAKSGDRDISFFNEANGIPWGVYRQVSMRTREEIFIDFNASGPFWAHDNLVRKENVQWFFSNYTHNPFCPPHIPEYIAELKRDDPEAYKVYGLGKTGGMGELVIPKITEVDEMPHVSKFKRWGYAIDFGFSSSPTTLVKCGWMNEKDLYIEEKFYARGMRVDHIDNELMKQGIERWKTIIGDYADGLACAELRVKGWKIRDAVKGNESIAYGIQLLNQYNLFVTKNSENVIFEQKRYKYKQIKAGELAGKYTNEPVKAFNHTWDATRYWASINLKPLRKIPFKYDGYSA